MIDVSVAKGKSSVICKLQLAFHVSSAQNLVCLSKNVEPVFHADRFIIVYFAKP